jgi:hypothetical protein
MSEAVARHDRLIQDAVIASGGKLERAGGRPWPTDESRGVRRLAGRRSGDDETPAPRRPSCRSRSRIASPGARGADR